MRFGRFSTFRFLFQAVLCVSFLLWPAARFSLSQTADTTPADATGIELIHPGDIVEIDVVGSVDYDWRGTLDPDGNLSGFDKIEDKVFARCRSTEETARTVAGRLSGVLRDPLVTVRILDTARRFPAVIDGAVAKPARFLFKRPAGLAELIVLAGGLTEDGSGQIRIVRPPGRGCLPPGPTGSGGTSDAAETVYIDVSVQDLLAGKANPRVIFGDLVNVIGASPVYVIGGVANPGRLYARSEMTLSRAVAMAGDLSGDARPERITIFRRSSDGRSVIEADLTKIRSGGAEDPLLKPFDVVDVPVKGRPVPKLPPTDLSEAAPTDTLRLPLRVIE